MAELLGDFPVLCNDLFGTDGTGSAGRVAGLGPGNVLARSERLWLEGTQGRELRPAQLLLRSAVQKAESFGPSDVRLAVSLDNLAWLYYRQGKYELAATRAQQSLDIREKRLGRDAMEVAKFEHGGCRACSPGAIYRGRAPVPASAWRSARKHWAPSIRRWPRVCRIWRKSTASRDGTT